MRSIPDLFKDLITRNVCIPRNSWFSICHHPDEFDPTVLPIESKNEIKAQYEEALTGIKQQIEMVNENGTISKWQWDIDIDVVKADLQKDIDSSYEAIELLLIRKMELENKLLELNHSELIKN